MVSYVRKTAADFAYEKMKSAIIYGDIIPGQRINIEKWEKKLGVSRTPIRESLRKLEAEQLVNQGTNGWLFVNKISEQEVNNLYAVRIALEELAIEEAIIESTTDDIEQLRLLQVKMEQNKNSSEIPNIGKEFHELIYEISRNDTNIQIIKSLQSQIDRYRYLGTSLDSNRGKSAVEEHQEILEAVLARDIGKARRTIRSHILNSKHTVLNSLSKLGDDYKE